MHAAWERITKLNKVNLIEATHAEKPEQMRNALLAELNPAQAMTPFKRMQAVAARG